MSRELKHASKGTDYILNEDAVKLLLRKLELSKKITGPTAVPKSWQDFSKATFVSAIRKLDQENTGKIQWRHLATYLCLLATPISS